MEKNKKKLLTSEDISLLEKKLESLNLGKETNSETDKEIKFLSSIGLLSIKPKIIVCNVDEKSLSAGNSYTKNILDKYKDERITENLSVTSWSDSLRKTFTESSSIYFF